MIGLCVLHYTWPTLHTVVCNVLCLKSYRFRHNTLPECDRRTAESTNSNFVANRVVVRGKPGWPKPPQSPQRKNNIRQKPFILLFATFTLHTKLHSKLKWRRNALNVLWCDKIHRSDTPSIDAVIDRLGATAARRLNFLIWTQCTLFSSIGRQILKYRHFKYIIPWFCNHENKAKNVLLVIHVNRPFFAIPHKTAETVYSALLLHHAPTTFVDTSMLLRVNSSRSVFPSIVTLSPSSATNILRLTFIEFIHEIECKSSPNMHAHFSLLLSSIFSLSLCSCCTVIRDETQISLHDRNAQRMLAGQRQVQFVHVAMATARVG